MSSTMAASVTLLSVGTCTIDANQAGEDNRNVARMAVLLAGLAGGTVEGGWAEELTPERIRKMDALAARLKQALEAKAEAPRPSNTTPPARTATSRSSPTTRTRAGPGPTS